MYGGETIPADESLDVDYDATTVTLDSTLSGTFSLPAYNASVSVEAVNIDGSKVTNSAAIYGDDAANIIRAGKAGGTIFAGNGNDVIYCGRGTDTICYESDGGNNDTIYDYKTGDVIFQYFKDYYDDTTFKNVTFSGDDIIINFTSGEKITLKDAKDQRVSLHGCSYNDGYNWYSHYNTFGRVSISGSSVSLNSDYQGSFNASHYTTAFTTINASQVKEQTNIYGNDTIYCGAGVDSIVYESGGGNDTVCSIGAGDYVSLKDCTVKKISVSGTDVIISIEDSTNKITLKDATGKRIWISGQNWQTYTAASSADIIEDFWFTEDNNFVSSGGDLDSIIDESNSLANLNFNPVDADNIFAQDSPAISYNLDKKK